MNVQTPAQSLRQPVTAQDQPGALIIGGAHGSLAIARSLGRQGIPVWFVTNDHPIAGCSRYTRRSLPWAGPADPGAADWLIELARRNGLRDWVLFPGGDPELRLAAQHHDALSSMFRVAAPPWSIAQWTCDKRMTERHAASVGLDSPLSFYPRDIRDVGTLDCRFPVILKPTLRESANAFTLAKAWRADDRVTLLARYEQAAALVGERAIVIQELIPGNGAAQFSYAGVFDRGRSLAALAARRTRQYPIDFGYTSTFVETIDCADVAQAAKRFLAALDFSGLAEVEFKYDARDGRYKLLDVNARVWTWAALGGAAGLDFPLLAWRLAVGETVPAVEPQRPAAWMHGSRDFVAAVQEMLAGTLSPARYLSSFRRNLVFAAFAYDDPLPGLVEMPLALGRALKRRLPVAARAAYDHLAAPSRSGR